MTPENREKLALALDNAAEMIRGHVETGLFPEDVNEKDEEGLEGYAKACDRASKLILTLSKKYKK